MTDRFDIDRSPETAELLAIAEKELRETPENVQKGLAELRKLLKENPDLTFSDDDEFLTIVLRTCHWYPEGAIKLVNIFLIPEVNLRVNFIYTMYVRNCGNSYQKSILFPYLSFLFKKTKNIEILPKSRDLHKRAKFATKLLMTYDKKEKKINALHAFFCFASSDAFLSAI